MSLRVYYEVLNQKGSPALYTDTFANRPAFGFQGRLFISTDTAQIFEDTGTAWTLIADAGGSGFVPYTGATADVNLGSFDLTADIAIANQIKAVGSGGLSINANSGTQIAVLGAGGGANMTLYGGLTGTSASFSGLTTITGSTTASSGIARGANITSTLIASANGDTLVGLYINPTFTNGAFTNVTNYAARISGILAGVTQYMTTGASETAHYLELISTTSTNGYVNFRRNGSINGLTAYQLSNHGSGTSAQLSYDSGTGETLLTTTQFLSFATNSITGMQMFRTTRNVLLQNGGTFTDAGYRLDVNGTARVSNLLTATAGISSADTITSGNGTVNTYMTFASTSGIIGTSSNHGLQIRTNNIERVRIFTNGNVAINSSIDNGQGTLQVSGNIYVTGIGAAGSTYTVSSTLSTAYYHVFTGAAGQTLTLPSPASNNVQYVIINNTANTVTVAAATSTNIVTTTGTSVASITLIANQRVFILADGGIKYYQIF